MRIMMATMTCASALLTGCAAAQPAPLVAAQGVAMEAAPPAPPAPPPPVFVTRTAPLQELTLEQQQVLFWDDATRSARFRKMEDYFPGTEVKARSKRTLPRGDTLPGASMALLDAYLAEHNAAGIMVLEDGRVRYEKYGLGMKATDRWTSFSVAKSFTSTLLGAAVKDGSIASLDDPVSKYVPGLVGSAYDDVSIEQLATMTSGVAWNEDYSDPNSDVARMFAVQPVDGEPMAVTYMKTLDRDAPAGEKWVYKTGETNLIGTVVEGAVGMTLAEYAKEKIADPAGFEDSLFWISDPTDASIGGCCLSLRLSDYARFGQFVLDGGGDVVPDGWFARATSAQADLGNGFGYGYQWWTYPGGVYGAQGIFGQAITIVPQRNLVVAVIGNWPRATSSDARRDFRTAVAAVAAGK
ncbi:MAG: serine hydrolase domain-containing protein [Parerythrobacter sp.]